MLLFSHKIVFYRKRGCVTVRNYAGTCKGICSYNLVYNFLIQLLPLKSLVFVVHFLNAFWHGKETFPKSSSQNEIVHLLIVFHLPYSKYKAVKICFYSCTKFFTRVAVVSFVQHSCRTCDARFSLVSRSCRTLMLASHSCCIHVACIALVSLVSGTRVVDQTRSFIRNCLKGRFSFIIIIVFYL